jgi:hypothetical protein
VQLLEAVADVLLHGLQRQIQLLGDRRVALTPRDELQDLAFPLGELGERRGRASTGRCGEDGPADTPG